MPHTYTAAVKVTGEGRNGGHARSDDGLLDTGLSLPKELGGAGGATNPEQLFAAGWSACFLGAVRLAAAEGKIRLTSTEIDTKISLDHGDDGFSLAAVLDLTVGGITQAEAEDLAHAAHQICPYSKATRGNIPVTINAFAV
ncbi:organic hydroperoxide resistance protein [Streptomyces sp. NBC_01341]|uniref:organic hydroperoxide resistance protein n=1 Tax=Streptomyces sp. NBC_01341 TaxID=2903831 RepID=UPI002E0E9A31|nr:organic hydroperoxide resistance protein [Streptomyces sp. NBC_01341]